MSVHRIRRIAIAAAALGVVAAAAGPTSPSAAVADPDRDRRAPVLRGSPEAEVPGSYIVVTAPGAPRTRTAAAADQAMNAGGRITHRYHSVLEGFSARLTPSAVEQLRSNPTVAYVEADQRVSLSATQSPAPWGLDRIDQRARPLDDSYNYVATGAGVTAYVVDSGLRRSHSEFTGRVAKGYSVVRDGRGTRDCNGHGTHVAGTIGGTTYGVAKGVTIRPVRVLNCKGSGSVSGIIAGLDWVAENHDLLAPAVANMSLGSTSSKAMDDAVGRAIADGVTVVAAAGNSDDDACNYSPARVPAVITVGSTTKNDSRSWFSNWGSCLDVFAPGSGVKSSWIGTASATKTISGTSMAAPHVAGAAARYLEQAPTAAPARVTAALVGQVTTGVVSGKRSGSPNKLLYVSPGRR